MLRYIDKNQDNLLFISRLSLSLHIPINKDNNIFDKNEFKGTDCEIAGR